MACITCWCTDVAKYKETVENALADPMIPKSLKLRIQRAMNHDKCKDAPLTHVEFEVGPGGEIDFSSSLPFTYTVPPPPPREIPPPAYEENEDDISRGYYPYDSAPHPRKK